MKKNRSRSIARWESKRGTDSGARQGSHSSIGKFAIRKRSKWDMFGMEIR